MRKPNLVEKGFFHLFGELYLDGINSLRSGPPDRSECVLSMGRIAGQYLCPEQESFQIKLQIQALNRLNNHINNTVLSIPILFGIPL